MNEVKVGNSHLIHNLNQAGIFRLIHKYSPISRKELADNTGYSAATVSNHVRKLIENGYLIETEKGDSTGGRKPVYLTVNPEKGYIIVVVIGVNDIKIGMFNLKLAKEESLIFPIKAGYSQEEHLDLLIKKIKNILLEKKLEYSDIVGIGIAVPGLIDKESKTLHFAPNLGWSDLNFKKHFNEEFKIPMILENEANASVIGEREYIYPQSNNLVFVSINEGIGCGIIFDGNLYQGASGNAGEFGHIIIDNHGDKCHCGNYGCWETLASENYLIELYKKKTGCSLKPIEIYKLIEKGEPNAVKSAREIGKNIGIGLVNIINGLSPEMIVIGGHIVNIKDYIMKEIDQVLEGRALGISYQKVKLDFTKLNDMAAVHGLAHLVHSECLDFE